ncbi:MAG: hypothetical protein KF810_06230 [Rhizobiaceae bacterium]|nr:hypothetical protein [Rhizobiaceae bacterium]
MRDNKAPETHGDSGTSKLKKELREMDKDPNWKGDALTDAERNAKESRRPGATPDEKSSGLADKRHYARE